MPSFDKILIANRGEIAVRIIRACTELGIRSVAVYSDADRAALHVRLADEAYRLGASAPRRSYLDIDKVVDAARRSGAQAIHPGYGFLAENPDLARACEAANLVFIGPPASAMEAVGDKVRARELMSAAGVPVVPGTQPLSGDVGAVAALADELGYPVLLKAAAGGGGKGMRVVREAAELPSLLAQARGEAATAFGNDTVFLEKFVVRPRHIEVQVLADAHGNCVYLGERECSIQRRHQKLIEECPSPVVDARTRRKIGQLAVKAMQAAGYVNAGTVEFLRGEDGSFYFMEVNARLQVEHPVTEMVTGVDLVKLMIDVAAGNRLTLTQKTIEMRGHAIECRIIAEDPARNFTPSPGKIRSMRAPAGPGIRYDEGIYPGYEVPVFYDPLLAKLIAWGGDRIEATARMARALDELRIDGPTTSVGFHRRVMDHAAFVRGDLHTGFLEEHADLLAATDDRCPDEVALIAAAVAHFRSTETRSAGPASTEMPSVSCWRWQTPRGWRQ